MQISGPHPRVVNQNDIATYGSQGQNRLAILSIKLGLLKYINESHYENAIVVLDDVLSELDITKRKNLLSYLSDNNQVFITTANKKDVLDINLNKIKYIEVRNGTIKEE